MTCLQRSVRSFALVTCFVFAAVLAGCSTSSNNANAPATTATTVVPGVVESSVVLDKQARTVLDQLLEYPTGSQAQVSSAILTLAPGVSTGLHKHDAPLYAYVLEGTLTVTYDGGIVKKFSAGSAILEAVGTAHNGENKTDQPVKLLVVNIGAEGVANSVKL